ncbi:MAG: GNAT family N-acetyltransferase [Anaerolineales bacterium]
MPLDSQSFSEKVALRDGTQVELRPIRPDDAVRLQGLFSRLSSESVYLRFLEARKQLSLDQAIQFATVDYRTTMAIVAVLSDGSENQKIIGVARYGVEPETDDMSAEAAIVVEDDFQNRGLGTLLLQRLLDYAREQGIPALRATVHQNNAKILQFIKKGGLPTERRLMGSVWELKVTVDQEDEAT